jgi:hypothetical protein
MATIETCTFAMPTKGELRDLQNVVTALDHLHRDLRAAIIEPAPDLWHHISHDASTLATLAQKLRDVVRFRA